MYKWRKWLQYQLHLFYLMRVCSIQATSKEYRIPHVSWSSSQGSRLIEKTRAGKLRKKRRKPKGKGKQERGRGMPHRLNNHQSLNKEFQQPVSVKCLAHFGFTILLHAQTFHDVKFVLACICSVMTELHLAMYSIFYWQLTWCEMASPITGTFKVSVTTGEGVWKCAFVTVKTHCTQTQTQRGNKEKRKRGREGLQRRTMKSWINWMLVKRFWLQQPHLHI